MKDRSFLRNKKSVIFLAFIYTFLWGCAFPLVKICMTAFAVSASDNVSKMLVAGVRFFCSGILTLALSLFFKKERTRTPIKKSDIGMILLYGLLGTSIQYAFTYIGLSNVSGSVGALFDQLGVFFIIIVSGLFFADDSLTLVKVAGCTLGFVGIAFTVTDGISISFHWSGEGMMLMAALSQTVAYLLAKRSMGRLSALKFVGFSHLFGGGILTVFSYIAGGRITNITTSGIITLLMLIAISSGAYVLSLLPLKYYTASEISVFNLLIPIFGGVMSGIVLQEDVWNLRYLLALLLVVLGICLVNIQTKRRRSQ